MSVSPKEKGHTRRPLPPPRPQTHTPRHSSTSLKEASVTSSSPRPHAHLHAHALWHVRRGPSAYLLSVEARSGSEGREGLGRNGANVWGFLERHARGGGRGTNWTLLCCNNCSRCCCHYQRCHRRHCHYYLRYYYYWLYSWCHRYRQLPLWASS